MEHHFNVSIAAQYDVNVAIFLNNMAFWIQKNASNNKHFYDGRYWTYNTISAYSTLFPYWTYKQVRSIIDRCLKEGLIVKGNYNTNKYDRTCWYGFSDMAQKLLNVPICPKGQINLPSKANLSAEKGRPIPDRNTDRNTDKRGERKKHLSLSLFFEKSFDLEAFMKENEFMNKLLNFNIDPQFFLNKFIAHMEEKGKKFYTIEQMKEWVEREIFHAATHHKVKAQSQSQSQSMVKEFKPSKTKVCDKNTAKAHLDAIMASMKIPGKKDRGIKTN